VFYSYGFRTVPYKSRITLRTATTTKAGEINADLKADFRFERSDRKVLLKAKLLNADVIRYFGFGNETVRATASGFYNVIQKAYSLEPTVELGITGPLHLRLGGLLRWSNTDEERATLLTLEQPYGTGTFAEAGATAALRIDTRDHVDLPTRGVTLELNGRAFPAIMDVRSAFGSVGVLGTSYFTARSLPLEPTLAFQLGAQRALGTAPFFEAPDLGGWQNFRGLTTRRFIGDAAVHANADVRLNVGSVLGGGKWGLLGLGDLGRVFQDGQSSSRLHYGLGAGLWMAVTSHVFTATLASGGERLRFYIKSGFHF
jgi:outer membrane protein assembly factor BamA